MIFTHQHPRKSTVLAGRSSWLAFTKVCGTVDTNTSAKRQKKEWVFKKRDPLIGLLVGRLFTVDHCSGSAARPPVQLLS